MGYHDDLTAREPNTHERDGVRPHYQGTARPTGIGVSGYHHQRRITVFVQTLGAVVAIAALVAGAMESGASAHNWT